MERRGAIRSAPRELSVVGVLAELTEVLAPGEVPRVLFAIPRAAMIRSHWSSPIRPRCLGFATAGRLQLLGEIARGGMGAVLKGRDLDLGRDLAIKVLLETHRHKPDLVRRFVEEAQIGGQLQHPGIVPIYEMGAFADRRPYFAMKLVKGRTLAAMLDERLDRASELPQFLGDLRGRLPDDRLRSCSGRGPSRPEAVEHHGRLLRRGPGDGLGPCEGLAAGGRCRRCLGRKDTRERHGHRNRPQRLGQRPVAGRQRPGHSLVHVPRAGPRRGRPPG